MRCRVGDLAIILADRDCPENIGRFCTVLRFVPANAECRAPDSRFVFVGISTSDGWLVEACTTIANLTTDGHPVNTKFAVYPDRRLRPIRPTDEPDELLRDLPADRPVAVTV